MRTSRLTKTIGIALTAIVAGSTLAACGSAGTKAADAPPSTTAPKLVLSAGTAAGSAADAAAPEPALYPASPPTYVVDGTLADLGSTGAVRTLAAHPVSAADVAHIASALGMNGTPQPADSGFVLRDGDAFLSVTTNYGMTSVDYSSTAGSGTSAGSSGSTGSGDARDLKNDAAARPPIPDAVAPDAPTVAPADGDEPVSALPIGEPTPEPSKPMPSGPPPTTTPPPVDVPNADDAARIAQTLLDKLGVLAGADWTHTVDDAGMAAITCAPNADCAAEPATVSSRTVTYRLTIDGIEIPGVEWSVTIGEHAQVVAVYGAWVRPESPVDYPLRSTDDAFVDLQKGDAGYAGPQPLGGTAAGAAEIAQDSPLVDPAVDPAVDPTIDPAVDPVPGEVRPMPAIHVTGVALGLMRWDGVDGETPVAYVVPTYRFHARADDGSTYDIEVLALDPASFDTAPVAVAPGSAGQEVEK